MKVNINKISPLSGSLLFAGVSRSFELVVWHSSRYRKNQDTMAYMCHFSIPPLVNPHEPPPE